MLKTMTKKKARLRKRKSLKKKMMRMMMPVSLACLRRSTRPMKSKS
jgi:hypothetical protein